MNIAIHAANGVSLHQFCLTLMRQLASRGHRVIALATEDSFFPSLRRQNIPLYNTRLTEDKIAILALARYILSIRRILKRERTQLLHLMTPRAILCLTVMTRLMGIKTVCVFTGLGYIFTLPPYHPLRLMVIALFRIVLTAAHRVVFLNRDDLRYFTTKGLVAPEKARLIRSSGVDIRRYRRDGNSADDAPYPRKPVFLFVGRLMFLKGIVRFLEAARQVHADRPEARFLVVGSNEYGNRKMIADRQIARYRALLGDAIEFVGHTHDVRPCLQRASVLVLPTRYREGVPQSILEAMAYRLPIIATDMPGCREAVIDGTNGFLIPPVDSGAPLVQKMLYFVAHPAEIARMGEASRRIVTQHFTTDIVNRHTIDLYHAVAGAV